MIIRTTKNLNKTLNHLLKIKIDLLLHNLRVQLNITLAQVYLVLVNKIHKELNKKLPLQNL